MFKDKVISFSLDELEQYEIVTDYFYENNFHKELFNGLIRKDRKEEQKDPRSIILFGVRIYIY